MNAFTSLFRSTRRKSSNRFRPPNRQRLRLNLERLETRLAPANTFVVPVSQPLVGFNFYTLREAVTAAGPGDVVTIEPGASPDNAPPVYLNQDGITIQGDPNVPASILPSYQLNVIASNVKLVNLNLSAVTLGVQNSPNYTGNLVSKCLINSLTEYGAFSAFTQNTITDHASFVSAPGGSLNTLDTIANNTFATTGPLALLMQFCQDVVVTNNAFYVRNASGATAIDIVNSGSSGHPITISNNTIVMSGPATGISVNEGGNIFPSTNVKILNNTISTNSQGTGTGLQLSTDAGGITALVQGNDFWNNSVGVSIIGSNSGDPGTIDLGGGSLGSLGGNDFRGWTNASLTPNLMAAIALLSTSAKTPSATNNMFLYTVSPDQVCVLNNNPIDLSTPLSRQEDFFQSLYNKLLGRTGTKAEIDAWFPVYAAQGGQGAVANGILRSTESLGRIVDSLYLRFLGRQADSAGRAGWITALQNGATMESIETGFLTSPEYLHHINTDFVQSLYINILGRTGSAGELAFWDNQIQTIRLAGVANGFVLSQEYKNDNINADFQTFVHRPPTVMEMRNLGSLQTDFLGLEAAILGWPGYLDSV